MKYKKIMFMLVLAVFLLSITCVSASEIDDTLASENANTIELSTDNDIEDNLQTSEENTKLGVEETDETLSSKTDSEILTADQLTYSDLRVQIESGGNINLTKGTYTYNNGDGDTIQIITPGVINGNGAVIDMNNSNLQAFKVSAENVTLNNITFMNVDFDNYGGAVYFNATHGSVTNCYFKNNHAPLGSSIFFNGEYGSVINSSFVNNAASNMGGAIFALGNYFSLINCSFIENRAVNDGGAVYIGDRRSVVHNCNFSNNSARTGGAIYIGYGSNMTDCNFTNNNATKLGGAIYVHVLKANIHNCTFSENLAKEEGGAVYTGHGGNLSYSTFIANNANEGGALICGRDSNVGNCNFFNNAAASSEYGGGAISFWSTASVRGCNFMNNSAPNFGGAISCWDSVRVNDCNFTNNHAETGSAGAIYFDGADNSVFDCSFIDNTAQSNGGAVYFSSSGTVTNCNFVGNNATYNGGAIFFGSSGTVINCNFVNNIASNGSAVYFYYDGEVANCNFVNNFASNYGGAVYFNGTGEVANCNFVNSSASNRGGAVYFNSTGGVSYCNFNNNQVNEEDNSYGGAVFMSSGSVENCNFTNNKAAVYGGAIYFSISGSTHTVTNCIFTNNSAMYGGGAILFTLNDYLANCIFINNSARAGGAVYFINNSEVTNCNFVNNFASVKGGALYFGSSSTVEKCNFTNNTADGWGGAIRFIDMGNVTDCNFVNNTASTYGGGAMHFSGSGTVEKSNFINNIANTGGAIVFQDSDGNVTDCNFTNNYAVSAVGAILFNGIGNVTDCNFVNNTASIYDGGAVYFGSTGSVENCNFTNNSARYGGAVYFELGPNGTVKNCNFINNAALKVGGAVYYNSTGSVENCNFINNTASRDGGAILFEANANVTGCNFTGNSAKSRGGAVYFNRYANVENSKFSGNYASNGGAIGSSTMCYGDVDGCVFTNNSAFNAGAVYMYTGIIENCNFANNLASNTGGAAVFSEGGCFAYCNFANNIALNSGGAISIFSGIIENCNFTGNNATEGSAINLNGFSDTNISNSRFLNNRANASADVPLNVTVNGNTIEITFMGQDNLLNAIYSNGDVNFTNVTYWGANGIANTGDNPIVLSPSMCEAGQNISVTGIVNGNILTTTKVTDGNGKIVLENISDYYLILRHDGDSYYTEAEKTISNMKFNVNVTSQTTTNRTVNITAKSNILNETMPGKLLFILPNGTEINANYDSNGTWWAEHTFEDYGVYQVNALYEGLNNVTVNKGILAVIPEHTFYFLNYTINGNDNPVIELSHDFYFDPAYDSAFVNGIVINRPVTIKGNGYTIDAKGQARILYVQADNVNITNITFVNGKAGTGGAILWYGANGAVSGSSFTGNNAYYYGGAIYWTGVNGNVSNSIFINNTANWKGDAIYGNRYLIADYCWFGGNATNYKDDLPIAQAAYCDYILFLNATANPNEVPAFSTSEIVFKLYLYNKTSTTGNISEYDNTRLLPINLTVTSTNGDVDIHTVNLGDSIRYTATGVGDASVTATIENVAYTIGLNNIMANPNLSAENQVITYGENATIALNYNTNATGKVNITLTGKKGTFTYTNLDLNATIMLPKDIPADEYNVTVSYSGDVNFFNATANATLTVNKANSTLTINDNVTFDYGTNGSTTVSYTNATGVNASVVGQPNAIVVVNDTTIAVSGLNAGNYTLTVTTIPDANHNAVTKFVNIIVKKDTSEVDIPDEITNDDGVLSFDLPTDATGTVTITIENKNYTARIIEGKVNIDLPNLKNADYPYVITYSGDDKYSSFTKTGIITINQSSIKARDMVINYGNDYDFKATFFDNDGSPLANAYVIFEVNGIEHATKTDSYGFAILKLGLNSGTYVITSVNTRTGETKINNLIINGITTNLILSDVVTVYKGEKDLVVTLKDINGKPLSSVQVSINLNGVKYLTTDKNGQVKLSTNGLVPNTYTAIITFAGNNNYAKSSATAKVTVKKATPKLTAKKKTFKKAKKVKKYSITLKVNGKAMKKVKLTIKIGKKKFTAKTNSKGKATFKIKKLTKKGKYAAKITYKGNKYYNKVTKKVKIKLK